MKNFVIAALLLLTLTSISFAGESCSNGVCVQPRKVVSTTRTVVRDAVRLPKRVFGSLNTCTNGSCRSRNVTVVR